MGLSFKAYVWVLALTVGTAVTGGTVRAAAPSATNNQVHDQDYSKGYQQGLRGGRGDHVRNLDQFSKRDLKKDGDQKPYEELAWLVAQMNNPANAASVSNINCAIWGILDPASTGSFNWLTNNELATDTSSAKVDSPGWWLAQAQDQTYPAGQVSNSWTPRPITITHHPRQHGGGPPVITTPESPAPILLGADLLGLAGLIFFFRRRMLQTQR